MKNKKCLKTKYRTQGEVIDRLRRKLSKGDLLKRLGFYKCDECGSYHFFSERLEGVDL